MKFTELDSWEGGGVKSGGGVVFFYYHCTSGVQLFYSIRNPYSEVCKDEDAFTYKDLVRL